MKQEWGTKWLERDRKAKRCNGPMRHGPQKGQPVCYYTPASPTFLPHANAHTTSHTPPLTHRHSLHVVRWTEWWNSEPCLQYIRTSFMYQSLVGCSTQTNTHSVTLLRSCVIQTIVSGFNTKNILPSHLLDRSCKLTPGQMIDLMDTVLGLGTLLVPFSISHHTDGQIWNYITFQETFPRFLKVPQVEMFCSSRNLLKSTFRKPATFSETHFH